MEEGGAVQDQGGGKAEGDNHGRIPVHLEVGAVAEPRMYMERKAVALDEI